GHIHSTGQVRARDRLMLADQVQRDAPIDVARCCACGYLKISGVDFAHLKAPFVRSWDNMLPTLLFCQDIFWKVLERNYATTARVAPQDSRTTSSGSTIRC